MNLEFPALMNPSEVRDFIGHQHIQLRILCVEVAHACHDCADPRRTIAKWIDAVEEHLHMEDVLLIPALRDCDGWGPVRAERVAEEHRLQRAQLATLRTLTKHGAPEDVARAADELIAALLADMDAEEKDLLSPDLLRDDLVVVDQSGG